LVAKGFSLILVFLLLLQLCACSLRTPEGSGAAMPVIPEVSIRDSALEKAPIETTPPPPEHCEFYLPQYTAEQITEYFNEVVLAVEYSDGTGNPSLVQKWLCPITYKIFGNPTQEDLAVLKALFVQLNQIPGFPGISPAPEGTVENLSFSFWPPEAFRNSFSSVVNGEDAYGATQFWYYTATNDIYTARIGYRTDIDQNTRNSILIEEVINTLGITDTVMREDSIVYQYSDDNTKLSDVDLVILKLLYDPAIQCGMNSDECAAVISQLYY